MKLSAPAEASQAVNATLAAADPDRVTLPAAAWHTNLEDGVKGGLDVDVRGLADGE